MGDTIVSLLPFIIGSALVPVPVIMDILLLKSPHRGLLKATALVAGITTIRIIQGLLFGLVFFNNEASASGPGGKGPLVSTLLLVLGMLLLVTAYKTRRTDEDPDAPPPGWMTMLDSITPLKAFFLGAGILLISAKMWVFTLSAIGVIGDAQLGQPASTVVFILFVLLAETLLLLPIVIRILLPRRSISMLEFTSNWLNKNNRSIVIAVSFFFGLFFLYQGVSGLL